MKRTAAQYSMLSKLLDEALDLPEDARGQWIEQLPETYAELQPTLRRLLLGMPPAAEISIMPGQIQALARDAAMHHDELTLVAGTRVGAYRLIRELGRGGMGSVWLAQRSDGAFKRSVALKLPHLELSRGLAEATVRERDILAGLEHPGIARLYGGGLTVDGRPYMAMEYIEGENLIAYCDRRRASLEERLNLFIQICVAVSYAHAHLVVHRDLKPANIFVTGDGQVKLLDFGIAKLLEPNVIGDVSRTARVSPAYAAPEQLAGRTVTTASDVYALGVILFQLLSGRLPWLIAELPFAAALRLLEEAPARPSAVLTPDSPLTAGQLRGDLDAIVAKALRKEPASRYPDARTLAADLERHRRHEPVKARSGARVYVLRRFLRRRWLPLTAAASVFIALAMGTAVALWQAQRAQSEAGRATATKDFLISLFRASDPRIAQDKPRGEITAKELLDLGSARIEKEFAAQPELQIELLGLTARIYDDLADEPRYAAVQQRRIELARAHYGPAHPIVIEGLLDEADAACLRQNTAKATEILSHADALLRTSGQDQSLLRALWWRVKARAVGASPDGGAERALALNQALTLYAKLAPRGNGYAEALNMASRDATDRGDHLRAKTLNEQALAVAEAASDRDDALIGLLLNNLSRKQENLGEFEAADATYQRAEAQERRTSGEHHSAYWITTAYHARLLHRRGQRDRASALFSQMLQAIPPDWRVNSYDVWAREVYADCLAAEGRAGEAVPLLEAAYRVYLARPVYSYDVREVRRELGNAYDRAGRSAEARPLLQASRDEYLAKELPGSEQVLRSRTRWGRFLLDHSKPGDADFGAAEAEFRAVVANAANRLWTEAVQAHVGLARIATLRGDLAVALDESRVALRELERVQGLYDVRLQPEVWLVYSAVLLKRGTQAAARQWAEKSLAASQLYDVASADSIKQARSSVDAAIRARAL